MMENIREQFAVLPGNLANHLAITVIPLAIGVAVSLPLAVLVVKKEKLRYPTLTVVSVVQTIPSLALLALMVPLFIALGALTTWAFGIDVPSLGFYPAVVALTLYSILPILRNSVTGILGVDPAMTEAARATGMTPRQVLWKVELPLAFPVIIAGVRTATVWVVGIATLATPVGQRCLGNYIFRGLQTQNWTAVLFGVFAAAVLAIGLDLLIGGVEKGAKERRRPLMLGAMAGLTVALALGLTAPAAVSLVRTVRAAPDAPRAEAPAADEAAPAGPVVVGSKTFTEQYILANLMTGLLRDAGITARERESLGSTVIFDAITSGEIDAYIDYSGTIWANHMKREEAAPGWSVLAQVEGWLADEHGVRTLGALGFENAYVFAMRREQAEELGVETVADLAEHAPDMKVGGDYEFFGRPEWSAVRAVYGLQFADQISYDATFMYQAVAGGDVDVIGAFSTDGRIAAFDLKVLDDPRGAFPPYDALLLLSPQAAERERVVEALRPLIGAVSADAMRQANKLVDVDGRSVGEAAARLREAIPAGAEKTDDASGS